MAKLYIVPLENEFMTNFLTTHNNFNALEDTFHMPNCFSESAAFLSLLKLKKYKQKDS